MPVVVCGLATAALLLVLDLLGHWWASTRPDLEPYAESMRVHVLTVRSLAVVNCALGLLIVAIALWVLMRILQPGAGMGALGFARSLGILGLVQTVAWWLLGIAFLILLQRLLQYLSDRMGMLAAKISFAAMLVVAGADLLARLRVSDFFSLLAGLGAITYFLTMLFCMFRVWRGLGRKFA